MFEASSRYYQIENATLTLDNGQVITYKKRRFLPDGQAMPLLQQVTVAASDRLDRIAGKVLGDPEQFWRICDANNAMYPLDLTTHRAKFCESPLQVNKMSLGIHLTLLIGQKVPAPAPPLLLDAIQKVQVTNSDEGRDGFQITFSVGRSGSADASDYALLASPLLKQFNRVIIMVAFGVLPRVLIDGVITNQQLNPSSEPGKSTFTVTGEDLSVLMDLQEKSETYPNQTDDAIVTRLILAYSQYGLTPKIVPPASMETPMEVNTVSSQQTTDLKYIRKLGKDHDCVFYIEPADIPGVSTAYWGPSCQDRGASDGL